MKKSPKIGLALGGGAVLGAAHIGVLKALKEKDIPISFVAGTSAGAVVSAFYAFNKDWAEIKDIVLSLNWLNISAMSLSRTALLSNKKLGEHIIEHLGDVTFDQSSIPLAMIATDISNGEKVLIKEGRVADAVMASACIPGLFKPLEVAGKLLVDGGIVENVPITPLKEMGADFIIAVDLNTGCLHKKPENIVEVLLNTFDFTIMAATKLLTKSADILIKPDLSSFNRVDADQTADLFEKGYQEATEALKDIHERL